MVSGRANGHPSSLRLDGMDPDQQLPTSETQAKGAPSSTIHKTRKRAGTESRSVQLRLFEGAAASFFALFGILSSYTAFLCLFLGLLFSALALRLWLLNHHRTKSVATFWCLQFSFLAPWFVWGARFLNCVHANHTWSSACELRIPVRQTCCSPIRFCSSNVARKPKRQTPWRLWWYGFLLAGPTQQSNSSLSMTRHSAMRRSTTPR